MLRFKDPTPREGSFSNPIREEHEYERRELFALLSLEEVETILSTEVADVMAWGKLSNEILP